MLIKQPFSSIGKTRLHSQKKKKKSDTFSICACHPCAGAMLIFSVSFQFYRMRRVLPRSKSRWRSAYFVLSNKKKKKKQKKVSQREARTLNLPVNSRARCQLRHPGTDNDCKCQINSNLNRSRHRRQKKQKKESIPGLEPGISCSVGRRLIHWAIQTWLSSCQAVLHFRTARSLGLGTAPEKKEKKKK